MDKDPFMHRCIYDDEYCSGRVEWEHAFLYAGKQINEWWAIVGCCANTHHRGKKLDKKLNQYVGLTRAVKAGHLPFIIEKYPRVNWLQLYKGLETYVKRNYPTYLFRNSKWWEAAPEQAR